MKAARAGAVRAGKPALGLLALALSGCPNLPNYPPTVTPIYAATSSGLSIYNGAAWTTYSTSSGLPSATVNGLAVAGNGSSAPIFAATGSGISLSLSGGSSWTTALSGVRIASVFIGNEFYAATPTGVDASVNGESWFAMSGSPANANCLFAVGSTVYAATSAGLSIYNGVAWTTTTSGLASDTVNGVFVDADSYVYAATESGLSVFNGSSWATYLGGSVVNGVFVVGAGSGAAIYAATAGGVEISLNGGTSWTNHTGSGLGSSTVYGVAVDLASNLYAATASGLSISTNGGASWSNDLPGVQVNGVVVTAPLYSY